MNISIKRAGAIFIKDYKEFSRNYGISIILLVPIVFAFLFRAAGASLPGASGFLYNISFVLLTCMAQACLIAEEKERNMLRPLMLTRATAMDVLIGKSSLVFVMSAVTLTMATFIFGYKPASIGAFVTAISFSIVLYISAGTICGLFSNTIMEASLSILPVAFIFTGAPWGAVFVDDYPFLKVLDYAPSSQLVHLLGVSHTGITTGALIKPLLIIFVWMVVLTVVSVVLYQRRFKDK